MDREAQLAPEVVLHLRFPELASHFRSLIEAAETAQHDGIIELHRHLLAHVHSGVVPPVVLSIWLPLVLRHDPDLLRPVLLDQQSQRVRKAGLKALKHALRGKQWKENGWDAVGGAKGIEEIFQVSGVQDVRDLAKVIGTSNTSKDPVKATAIDELIQLMLPALLPASSGSQEAQDQSQRRPLLPELVLLVQGCSSDFLARCLVNRLCPSNLRDGVIGKLGRAHQELLRNIALGFTTVDAKVREMVLDDCLSDLVLSTAPWKRKHTLPAMSAALPPGTSFFMDLIHEIGVNPPPIDRLPKRVLLGHVADIVKRSVRYKVPFRDILVLLELGISTAETRNGNSAALSSSLPLSLMQFWAYAMGIPNTTSQRKLSHVSRPKVEHRELLESLLVRILRAIPEHDVRPSTLNHQLDNIFSSFDPEFPRDAYLPLIKLLCRHLAGVCIDLDLSKPSEKERRHLTWDVAVLDILPCRDAMWLFDRATSVRPVEEAITRTHAERPWRDLSGGLEAYTGRLLKVKWEAESGPQWERTNFLARKLLDEVKLKAERERDADQRSSFAQLAVDIAAIGTSVELLEEVSEWGRRFIRDHVVGPELSLRILDSDLAPLLSCAALSTRANPIPLSKLSLLLNKANHLLSFHIHTSLLALREPNFSSYSYDPSSLLRSVMSERLEGIRARLRLGLESEPDLIKVFLEPLVPIILEFERIGAAEGHEGLHWSQLAGPLQYLSCPKSPSSLLLRFMDDLARQRDELWNQIRVEREPMVAAIEEGWPRGLPVQALLPSQEWATEAVKNADAGPFVSARVKGVVFCDPEQAITAVPSKTDHIGPFCDSFIFALNSYIFYGPIDDNAKKILKIWEHYSGAVPASIGHVETFKEKLSSLARDLGHRKVARDISPGVAPYSDGLNGLPSVDAEAVEWDPWPNGHIDHSRPQTTIAHPQTLLQCQYNAGFSNNLLDSFSRPSAWKTRTEPTIKDIWKTDFEIRKLPLPTQDAIVVSALLYLDTLTTGSARLLSKPFPEGTPRSRYPSLYLSYDFLSAMGKMWSSQYYAVDVLQKLVSIIPPILLKDLASSMLKTLVKLPTMSPKYSEIQKTTINIIALLPLSDRPSLAVDLGLAIVKDLPDSSAWHRQVISLRLGRQLGHEDAEGMMREFATFVFDALETQRKDREAQKELDMEGDEDVDMLGEDESDVEVVEDVEMKDEPESVPPVRRHIKITTIKMLPQLLEQGDFTSIAFGLSTLRPLFTASHQIDVRRAVVGALLELLRRSNDIGSKEGEKVFATLASFAAPAAGPSERIDVSEEQWLEAEKGGPLPEINNDRPLFKFFVQEADSLLPKPFRAAYVKNVILPLLDESTKQHNRWMRAFLSRIELTPEEASVVNFGPFYVGSHSDYPLTHWAPYLPKSYLLQFRQRALSHLICRKLERVNDKLTLQNPHWKETNEGQYWQHYFTERRFFPGFNHLRRLLTSGIQPVALNGITNEDLMDEFCAQTAVLVREPFSFHSTSPYSNVSLIPYINVLSEVRPPRETGIDAKTEKAWKLRLRPVLQRISADIESIRSNGSWSKSPDRIPAILPPRIQLQARLLPYPHIDLDSPSVSSSKEVGEEKKKQRRKKRQGEFVSRVLALAEECVSSPSCVADFKYLTDAMPELASYDLPHCALVFGESVEREGNSLGDCLKIQLAQTILLRMRAADWEDKDEEVKKGVTAMIERWKRSPNEEVRLIGWTKVEGPP